MVVCGIIIGVFSNEIFINNKDELLKEFNTDISDNELILNIADVTIELDKEIKIKSKDKRIID